MTVFTAIVGDYDELKEPFVVTPGWRYVCFSDQPLQSKVWEIRPVETIYLSKAKTARFYKIMFHRHIKDEYSLWVDATFFINTDLNEWWQQFKTPFTTVFHPFDRCIYTDIDSCLRAGKGDTLTLIKQKKDYQFAGVPRDNGLISSGILMRRNTPEVQQFCEMWWGQVEKYTERDQVAFGYANHILPGSHQCISWDYTYRKEFIHSPHKHKSWARQRHKELIKLYGSNKTS